MALIKSISGIRGTIGGKPGETLSPLDVVKFTAAYGTWLLKNQPENKKVVIGRDGRISGEMVQRLVVSTLNAVGINVIDLGLSTTPTVEMAVISYKAAGGIILTASHNPKEWNALKLLNDKGEFISGEDGKKLLDIAASENFNFVHVDKLGSYTVDETSLQQHIDAVVNYPLVDVAAIKKQKFKIVIDAINSTGAIAVPALLKALGVKDIIVLNEEVNGKFAHNPEPLPQHLTGLCNEVNKQNAHLGIAVDPDVDRLCFVCEDGSLFGEEYTLVAVADYVLQHRKGNTVSNMSSTRALKDVTTKHGGEYFPSAVGEVNVVTRMKEVNAVIGGEGNGGIIVPDLHYGRDALIGIALFLTYMAQTKKSATQLRRLYPDYFMSKNKIELDNGIDVKKVFSHIQKKYKNHPINTEDGLKIEFDNDWVHLRTSNTEPIIRIYAESNFETTAGNIAKRLMQDIRESM
ncbi:phosphoglucosamine mutase [Panacibacter ginsenosidivorans]|uniref:Phosphoglucosamine mutase n=1 Tax=Panacibacter ginsenosidivorans TaxID=1813871 RepID=A0A5B8V4B1_9BACT|nr:phosphoglucosamine mutase [Panacibacter ginsenosidivorans]QEC65865.1 phosphoglucosamine mutase [Panacibacter ginsenosidivorans]